MRRFSAHEYPNVIMAYSGRLSTFAVESVIRIELGDVFLDALDGGNDGMVANGFFCKFYGCNGVFDIAKPFGLEIWGCDF